MMYDMPLTLKNGLQSSTAYTYSELIDYLTAIRQKHDPALSEKISVFNVKEVSPGRYLAHLEWNFFNADGALVQYSLLTYGLAMTNRGLVITSITVKETTQNAILADLPLIII